MQMQTLSQIRFRLRPRITARTVATDGEAKSQHVVKTHRRAGDNEANWLRRSEGNSPDDKAR